MLSAATLLNAWERGLAENPVQRAVTLLSLVWPEAAFETLADLSIGRRDWHLIRLREQLFGSRLEAIAHCPQCGEALELTLDVADLLGGDEPTAESGPILANAEGNPVRCRLPTSRDLLAVAGSADPKNARRQLLTRCVLDAPASVNLSEGTLAELGAQLQQADPQADVQLDLLCPSCGHKWLSTFDIASYLWNELNGWAVRTLREVHLLASAYGWGEGDILNLSARRRQIYLQLIGV